MVFRRGELATLGFALSIHYFRVDFKIGIVFCDLIHDEVLGTSICSLLCEFLPFDRSELKHEM